MSPPEVIGGEMSQRKKPQKVPSESGQCCSVSGCGRLML